MESFNHNAEVVGGAMPMTQNSSDKDWTEMPKQNAVPMKMKGDCQAFETR